MIEFQMPSLGADMDAGTLVEWYKRPGDPVKRGDVIALVETQKGAIEIEVFNDGLLGEIRVGAGQKVPVGSVLATILQPGEKPADKPDREVQRAEKPSARPVKEPVKPSPPPGKRYGTVAGAGSRRTPEDHPGGTSARGRGGP